MFSFLKAQSMNKIKVSMQISLTEKAISRGAGLKLMGCLQDFAKVDTWKDTKMKNLVDYGDIV